MGTDQPLLNRIIVVDPGHGTLNYAGRVINPGKTTTAGNKEHKIAIDISEKLGKKLKDQGATVMYTRTKRDYWRESYSASEDNKARSLFANEVQADIYLSIHCDWHPDSKVYGVTTIHTKNDSKKLGHAIQKEMVTQLKTHDRKVVQDSFTVLDHAEMPAVIIETGFMSHRKESEKLLSEEYQEKIAQAITKGVQNFLASQ